MPWEDFLRQVDHLDEVRLREVLKWLDDAIRESLRTGESTAGLSSQSVSRMLLFLALSISDNARLAGTSKSQINSANWTALRNDIEAFVESMPDLLRSLSFRSFSDDKIAQTATISTRTRGVIGQYFYSTVVLYIMNQSSSGNLDTDFFRRIAPREDRLFPVRAMSAIVNRFNFGLPQAEESRTQEMRINFLVKDSLYEKLNEYFNRYSVNIGGDKPRKQLHMIIYRPMRSNPRQFIKTFVSMYEKKAPFLESSSFSFTHIYDPPRDGHQKRFSSGKVIPLDDAIYFIGGQRPLQESTEPAPFFSLKVIAIRWDDLDRFHVLFPALVLTTSYRGKLMISRAAIRITPIDHSSKIVLKSVSIEELAGNLREDTAKEVSILEQLANISGEKSDEIKDRLKVGNEDDDFFAIAKQICMLANNEPRSDAGWSVPPGYFKGKGSKRKSLTKEEVNYLISEALGEGMMARFENELGESFNIWTDGRFGPLNLE